MSPELDLIEYQISITIPRLKKKKKKSANQEQCPAPLIKNYQVKHLNNSFEMNVEIQLVRHGTVCAVVV